MQKREFSCKRIVYTTQEVAETAIKGLRALKISASPYRCDICGMLHLEEKPLK